MTGALPADVRAGIARLERRFDLPPAAPEQLARLLALVAADPRAPTAVRDPAAALDAHVADALAALDLATVRAARRIADLGSGAGFPGLVLAAALPQARVALLESAGRKCAFLERALRTAGIANARVVCARAEGWADGAVAHDLVTARAVAPLSVLAEYAAPLLEIGGSLVAWKGRRDAREERDGAAAAALTGLAPREVVAVEPWVGAEHLHLHVLQKVRDTPQRFPRRPGMAAKRPLRADA